MLITGDVAINYYQEVIEEPKLEVIASTDDIAKIKEELNIKSTPIHHNFINSTYKKKGKTYTFHNVDAFPPLKKAMSQHILNNTQLKVASPSFLCSWAQMRCNYVHKDVLEWEKYIKYYENFYTINNKTSLRDRFNIKLQSKHLSTVGAMCKDVDYTPHSYKPFDKFDKRSLFNVFTAYDYSLYMNLVACTDTNNVDILSKLVWDKLDYTQKIDAVVEKATVDACNEYILPDLKSYEDNKKDSIILFKKSLMNLCSLDTSKWFSKFIMKNYSNIVECIDEDYLDILVLSIKSKQLKKL